MSDFQNVGNLRFVTVKMVKVLADIPPPSHVIVRRPFRHFAAIGQTAAEMSIFQFFKMATAAILDLCCACLDHPRSALDGLYRCAKLGWNRRCSFEDM